MDKIVKATKVFAFFTCGNTLLSKAICKLTKGEWSHTGIGFEFSDGSTAYYEALAGKGFLARQDMQKIKDWQKEKSGRKVAFVSLLRATHLERMLGACIFGADGSVTYGETQLLAHFLWEKLGRPIPTTKSTVICSEMVSRILRLGGLELTGGRVVNDDSVTPQHAFDIITKYYPSIIEYEAGRK